MLTQNRVRYINLGEKGNWEEDCLARGVIRIGFNSGKEDRFRLCQEGRWDELKALFVERGREANVASNFANQLRYFFDDDGDTVWVTFVGDTLYWGIVDGTPPRPHAAGDSVERTLREGWRATNLAGERLTKDTLPGALTQLASFRGTSCAVEVADEVLQRLSGIATTGPSPPS